MQKFMSNRRKRSQLYKNIEIIFLLWLTLKVARLGKFDNYVKKLALATLDTVLNTERWFGTLGQVS